MFKMKGIGPQGLGTSKVKLTNDCCPQCSSPMKHCGCGIIGPNRIGATGYPKSHNKKKDFKPHKMYKDGKMEMADTHEEHLELGEKGYTHSPNKKKKKRKRKPNVRKTTKGKGRNFRSTEEGAGMTKKGVAEYRRKNPGSKLKTAVTGKVKPGSKAAKRRKSFCARSKGWTGERGRAARRRWKC